MKKDSDIMILKKSPIIGLGAAYIIDQMEIQSSLGQAYLNNLELFSNKEELEFEFAAVEQTITLLKSEASSEIIAKVADKLSCLLDVGGSISNLDKGMVLSDVELYSIKNFAMISDDIANLLFDIELVNVPDVSQVVSILDPEGLRLPTFYIYDAYSSELASIRKQLNGKEEGKPDLYQKSIEIEDEIRRDLSEKLSVYAPALAEAMGKLAYLDVLIAKSVFFLRENYCKPAITESDFDYEGLYNPDIKYTLSLKNKEFQVIDINFARTPNLITGINMGGKTVVLKTLALSQYLFQFGFYLPARKAALSMVNKILVSIDDKQNHLEGLSSFAAEMKNVNDVLDEIKEDCNILVLFDELARTTNPTEGRAIVCAMLEILKEYNIASFITSHYDNISVDCRRLRVKGLRDVIMERVSVRNTDFISRNIEKYIDYSLIDDSRNDVPHEALTIAEMMGVNEKLIRKAKRIIKNI